MDDKEKAENLVNYAGLSLVDFYVVPHFKEFPFIESTETVLEKYSEKLRLIPINNKEAIIVNGSEVEKK